MYDLLNEIYNKEDIVIWDTKCEKCFKRKDHIKNVKFSKLPEILIISFQRYNTRTKKKNRSNILFEEFLSMENYIDKELCK